jgi:acyl-CoA thioesterase-2
MLLTRAIARADLHVALQPDLIQLDRFVEAWFAPDAQNALQALVARLGNGSAGRWPATAAQDHEVAGQRPALPDGLPPDRYNQALFTAVAAPLNDTPEPVVSELIDLLTLERLEDNLFRGQSRDIGTKYVFGGQVLGQALAAAQATVDNGRHVHSLHAYFLRAGNIDHPIVYDVDRTRDGGSFSVRRVTAIQHGKVIFFCAASFQQAETGAEHQHKMPEVPQPEDIEPNRPLPAEVLERLPIKVQRWLSRGGPFEFRHVYPRDELNPPKRPPYHQVWLRLSEPVGDAPELHQALLAYASDFHLLGTATFPHGISYYHPHVQMASLDHAIWFHRPFRADDWLLYSLDSPSAQDSRGLARGQFFTRNGVLVASTAQEGLIRVVPDQAAAAAVPAKE